MSRTSAELGTYQQYGPITSYGFAQAGVDDVNQIGPNVPNRAWGVYQTDGPSAQNIRYLNDTLEAAAAANDGTPVARIAPITDAEIALVRETEEAEKERKWEQYWWASANPAEPWTMTELGKIDPQLVGRKLDAIRQTSQLALDATIIKHLGHGGNPQLAHLQYMMDQKMIDVPSLVNIAPRAYTPGPFSVVAQQGTHTNGDGRYDDQGLYRQRAFAGERPGGGYLFTPNARMDGGRAIAGALGGPVAGPVIAGVAADARRGRGVLGHAGGQ